MRKRIATWAMLAAGCLGVTGCADITLTTVDTQTEVLGSRREIVPSSSVKVASRIDGTTLFLQTEQGCDLVNSEDILTTRTRSADESLAEELTVLGLATVPLASGIIMLADAPNVYESDRNSRQYNSAGQSGAYIGGTILTAVGGLVAIVPIIELFRVAAAGDVVEDKSTRRGSVVSKDVACDKQSNPVRTSVVLRVGSRNLATRGTDSQGYLKLDLAKAIPYEVAKNAVTVQVIISGRVVGELAIEPILDAQKEQRRTQEVGAWKQVDIDRCETAPPKDLNACASVRAFLQRFPDGMYAEEAKAIIADRKSARSQVIATDETQTDPGGDANPDEQTPIDPAACLARCKKDCGANSGAECLQTCVKENCK